MQQKQMQFLAALRSGQRFLDDNASTLGEMNTTQARKTLDAIVERLTQLASAQDTSSMRSVGEGSRERRLATIFRRRHLRPIVALVKSRLPDKIQLSSVKLPREGCNITQLVEKGRAIAAAVLPFQKLFVELGIHPEFLSRLRAAADELVASTTSKATQRSVRVAATESLKVETQAARKEISLISAMILGEADVPASLVSEWRAAIRTIEGGRSSGVGSSSTPVVPAVSAKAA